MSKDIHVITLVFGAGASYGSGKCLPSNPPLGNYLFDDLVKLNGAYSNLSKQSKATFKSDGFEAGMATVANNSRVINPLQKELACFLSSFSVTPENAYVRFFNKLRCCMQDVSVATLNYDILIEQALALNGFQINYNGQGSGVTVLKPHGSSNFLPQLPAGWNVSNNTMIGVGTYFDGLETQSVATCNEVIEWCKDPRNDDLSPVLSMYEKGKRVVVNSKLINNIQEKYSKLIHSSKLVVLVGIKYVEHDQHIWQPIEKSNARVLVVDPYPEDTIAWANNKKLQQIEFIHSGFNDAVWSVAKVIRSHYL